MSDAHRHASGTAGAPLAATRRYSFTHVVTAGGEAKLKIPYCQRGSWDDFGIVEHPEQEVFVHRLLASLGVPVRSGYPGEFLFPDVASLDRAWAALEAALQATAAAPPAASAQRRVSADEAAAVSGALTARFLDLVSTVAGLSGEPFACVHDTIDTSGPESTRTALWRRGEVRVGIAATAIESGRGVHGERCTLTLESRLADGRDVSASAAIDARSGGDLSVTVRGVLDAPALADRFVAVG